MKNNRAKINSEDAVTIMNQLGEPGILDNIDEYGTQGIKTIVLLDLTLPSDIQKYEMLHNQKDDFEVTDETLHAGRYTVYVTIHYIRKGSCTIHSAKPSDKSSTASPKKPGKKTAKKKSKTEQPVIGFGSPKS